MICGAWFLYDNVLCHERVKLPCINLIFLVFTNSICYFFSFCCYPFFRSLVLPVFLLFSLLLDFLTFGFSYSPMLDLVDHQLSMLYRAIVWNAVVLGSNKKGGKLFWTITWKPFIWVLLSRGNFPGDNYLG